MAVRVLNCPYHVPFSSAAESPKLQKHQVRQIACRFMEKAAMFVGIDEYAAWYSSKCSATLSIASASNVERTVPWA